MMEQFLNRPYIVQKKNLFFLISLALYLISLIILGVDLTGFLSIVFVALITVYASRYYESLAMILYVALFFRLIAILLGNYFITLPESWGDAIRLEMKAWEYSQDGFFGVFSNFPSEAASYHMSWILAFFYSLTDRSPLMGQSISLIFGMGSVLIGACIANKIWNEQISLKVGWVLALYPTLILYSCLILREAYVWFFILIALYGVVCWFKEESFKSLIITFVGFFLATFYHGGMFIGGLIFLSILLLFYLRQILKSLKNFKISIKSLIILICSILSLFYFLYIADDIPKKLSFKYLMNLDFLLQEISMRNVNSAGYPEWTIPKSFFELIYKAPIRIMYFLFSPFPWDVTKPNHVIGLLDGTFFIILFILLIKNFKKIWGDQTTRVIFIILAFYLILFGISIGNFGTGLRHRTKFLIIFVLLVAPMFPNLTFNKKTKYKK